MPGPVPYEGAFPLAAPRICEHCLNRFASNAYTHRVSIQDGLKPVVDENHFNIRCVLQCSEERPGSRSVEAAGSGRDEAGAVLVGLQIVREVRISARLMRTMPPHGTAVLVGEVSDGQPVRSWVRMAYVSHCIRDG